MLKKIVEKYMCEECWLFVEVDEELSSEGYDIICCNSLRKQV